MATYVIAYGYKNDEKTYMRWIYYNNRKDAVQYAREFVTEEMCYATLYEKTLEIK